jgi:hypothetical protein
MKHVTRWLAAAVVAASLSPAQQLTVTVSPNPAPLGSPVTVTAQAAVQNLFTPFGCLITSVRSGTPNGPTVRLFPCTFLPGAIPLYGSPTSRTGIWDQSVNPGGTATPGLYWFEINHTPGMFGSPTTTEWYSVTISDPADPTPVLAAVNAPLFGSSFQMSLTAGGAHASEPYGIALSFTTNAGIAIPGGHVSLDADDLFFLSLAQDPTIFVNFSGNLDFLGNSFLPIQLNIPPVAGVLVVPIHAQAVVFATGGGLLLSNDLTIPIH